MKKNSKETDIVIAQPITPSAYVPAPRTEFFELSPKDQVLHATEIANVLSDVIQKQHLFTGIGGKKYIKAEGWQTLGTLLGIVPKEAWVKRHDNGTYEAFVELVKFRDGTIVGGASAICARSERKWSSSDEYAVRSMAVTRATGKAYRTSFAWIVTLCGYEPTPSEEMPTDDKKDSQQQPELQAEPKPKVTKPENEPPKKQGYDPQNRAHQDALINKLREKNIAENLWDDIGNAMAGLKNDNLDRIIAEVQSRSLVAGVFEAEVVL